MRAFVIIVSFFFGALFLGFKLWTNPVYITGHLKKNYVGNYYRLDSVVVFVKGDNKVLAYSLTDKNGNFEMTFTPNKEASFDFYCTNLKIDTMLIGSVKRFKSDTPDMIFFVPGFPKKTKEGKIICPKCLKVDKVSEIAYGDGILDELDDPQDTLLKRKKLIDERYYPGCSVGLATYYCYRDKIIF